MTQQENKMSNPVPFCGFDADNGNGLGHCTEPLTCLFDPSPVFDSSPLQRSIRGFITFGKEAPSPADKISGENRMWNNAHNAYLESRILSAGPIELVNLLYQGCTGAVREARHYLASGDIAARSRSITKASEILIELASSLDLERGGEISQGLGQLYHYMLRRLTEANLQQ